MSASLDDRPIPSVLFDPMAPRRLLQIAEAVALAAVGVAVFCLWPEVHR